MNILSQGTTVNKISLWASNKLSERQLFRKYNTKFIMKINNKETAVNVELKILDQNYALLTLKNKWDLTNSKDQIALIFYR